MINHPFETTALEFVAHAERAFNGQELDAVVAAYSQPPRRAAGL